MIEIGRVGLIEFGEGAGKLVTIVDVIDQNRALVDGTPSGIKRQAIPFRRLRLTKFKLPVARSTASKDVKKAFAAAELDKKFAATTLAKRMVQRQLVSFI